MRFAANPDNGNFSSEGTANLVFSIGGFRARVPVTMEAKADGSSVHGSVVVDMTSVSGSRHTFDVYVEQQGDAVVGYVRESGDATEPGSATDPGDTSSGWRRAQVDLPFKIDVAAVSELLSEAKFMRVAYESDDKVCYELTLPAQTVLDAILGKGQVSTSFAEVDAAALEEALGNSILHVRFDKNCAVRSVSLDLGFTQRAGDGIAVSADVDLDVMVLFDGYGSVAAGETAVPSSARESAVTMDPFDERELKDGLEALRR